MCIFSVLHLHVHNMHVYIMKYICKCLIVVLWLPCNSLHCCELQQQSIVSKILNTSIIFCYPFLWLFYNCYMLWSCIARIKVRFLPCCSPSSTLFWVSVGDGVMVILQLLALLTLVTCLGDLHTLSSYTCLCCVLA